MGIAGGLIPVVLFSLGFAPAEGNLPVRSVLEIRHERVVIQNWDLSCGAAALGTLLFAVVAAAWRISRGARPVKGVVDA